MTATVDDLGAGWRPLGPEERAVAETLLARAEAKIAKQFPGLAGAIAAGDKNAALIAVDVACQMVRRAMSGSADGAASVSLTAGPFAQSTTYRANDGALTLLDRERAELETALWGPRPEAVSMRSEGL